MDVRPRRTNREKSDTIKYLPKQRKDSLLELSSSHFGFPSFIHVHDYGINLSIEMDKAMKRGEKPKDYYRNEERSGGLLHLPGGTCYFQLRYQMYCYSQSKVT